MTKNRPSVTGQGPELFGRGIELLFGGEEEPAGLKDALPSSGAPPSASQEATMIQQRTHTDAAGGASIRPDQTGGRHGLAIDLTASSSELDAPAEPQPLELDIPSPSESPPLELEGPAVPAVSHESDPGTNQAPGPVVSQPNHLEDSTMPDQPRPAAASEAETEVETSAPGKRDVGTPGADVHGPGVDGKKDKAELSARLSKQDLDALTPQDIREIMKRLHKGDLAELDKEVDRQYDRVSTLLSGNRREATVAFEILRKARMILLKDPEQFAQAEYLVRQVQSRVHQIELSVEAGKRNAPKIFVYEVVWMIFLSIAALVTTVGGTTFSAWMAALLGVQPDSERLNWAVLFLSTLAWGGIGGVTSALWSLYYHVSIQRDYDPIENLWYYSQPVLGMVLGGMVFLIMGAGFLIVQVDLSGAEAALGARLLPAAVAVIVGFRQTVMLDLIERAIGLIAPAKPEEEPTLPTPPSEPI